VDARLFVHSRAVSSVQAGKIGRVGCWFIPKFEPGNLDPVFGDVTARIQMAPLINAFNPDVVLGFGTESIYGLLASKFSRPAAIFIQGIAEKIPLEAYGIPKWKRSCLRQMEHRAICRADAVIAENNFAADWAQSINPQIKAAVVPHPVTPEFLHIRSSYKLRIIFVGVLNSNKRPDMVVRAFAAVASKHPDAELVIVGASGDLSAELPTLITKSGLSGRVRLAGSLKRDEVMKEMSDARCLVLASRMDTSPNVITEAHAAGLPVIATRVGGIPEMVNDGQDGFLVGIDDEPAMADRMSTLLADRDLTVRMGEAGRIKVSGLNAAADVAERYVGFLKNLKRIN
jgi:glycosyltransferase involved in cell wall biosynthesis